MSRNPLCTGVEYIGFWKRLGATVPDLALAGIFAFFIQLLLVRLSVPHTVSWTVLITGIFYLVFYSPLWISSSYQATPGKIVFGIVVVDGNGKRLGRRLAFSRALVRELGKYVSLLPFGAGFAIIGFTKRKQGLHDLLARTVVTYRSQGFTTNPAIYPCFSPGKGWLRLATVIIAVCILCTIIPAFYFETITHRSVTPARVAARSLATAADSFNNSKYPGYSLVAYDTAIALQPDDPELLIKKIYFLGNTGKVDEARVFLDRMVIMYPNETTPLIFQGDLYLKEGKFQDAVSWYEKAIVKDPGNARIWIKKGDAYLIEATMEMTEMRGMYRNLTSAKPVPAQGTVPSDAFRSTKPYQEAVKAYNKAIELDPVTSIAITGRILSSTQNLLDSYEGILDDIGGGNVSR
ncbi:MAG: RDD family protein [Methanomicrobiales archaeon]